MSFVYGNHDMRRVPGLAYGLMLTGRQRDPAHPAFVRLGLARHPERWHDPPREPDLSPASLL